jgi:hypothetical protein|tara:strand:- start:518 stop:1768 length:1251 start_codon:yes stop_codon:yes gene_type:complete
MKFITALGLAAGGASKTIGEGLDREETRKARISRELQAQNSINAQFKLYGQKREDEINDKLQDLIGAYRGMDLDDAQIAGLIHGGDTTLEEVKKYYDVAQAHGANFSSLLTTTYGDGLTAESFGQQNFNTATQGFLDARLGPTRTPFKSPVTVGYSQELKDMLKASKMPVDPDEAAFANHNRIQIIAERIGTPQEKPTDKEALKKLNKNNQDITALKMKLEGKGAGGTGGDFQAKDRNQIRTSVNSALTTAFSEFATVDINGIITSNLSGTFDKAMTTFEEGIRMQSAYLNTINPMSGNVPLSAYNIEYYNEYAKNVGQKFNGNYKARLRNRLQNFSRADVPKFADQAQVQSSINTGAIKKGDVIMVANRPLIYNGITDTNDPNAFMDSEDIAAIPMPKLLRMNADGGYEYYTPSY